ncbi:MAG: hypothetical protein KDM64_12090 [Verrucomicrobiae bacterium]|nr:hypothetical protein [Verrucomicrobiae bacterium]
MSGPAETLIAMASEADDLERAVGGPVVEMVARWLAPTYAAAARRRLDDLEEDQRLEALRQMIHDLALLRRGDQAAEKLRLDHERLAWERDQAGALTEARFQEWLRDPAVFRRHLEQHLGDRERQRRIREIFGLSEPPPRSGLSDETLTELEQALKLL